MAVNKKLPPVVVEKHTFVAFIDEMVALGRESWVVTVEAATFCSESIEEGFSFIQLTSAYTEC